MKREKYTLKIGNPCGQDWSSMSTTDMGKFCNNCSKTVVDFTQLTDNEVLQIIERSAGKLCGRFTQGQLNRTITAYQPTNNTRFNKILAGLLLVSTTENLLATEKEILHKDIVSIVYKENAINLLTETNPEPKFDSLKNTVQGFVIDFDTKSPLSSVSILIKGSKIGTSTDRDGKFKLVIPKHLKKKKIYLVITGDGYNNTEVAINKRDLPITKNFAIVALPQHIMGDVMIIKE